MSIYVQLYGKTLHLNNGLKQENNKIYETVLHVLHRKGIEK